MNCFKWGDDYSVCASKSYCTYTLSSCGANANTLSFGFELDYYAGPNYKLTRGAYTEIGKSIVCCPQSPTYTLPTLSGNTYACS